jgi:hypothetical protein
MVLKIFHTNTTISLRTTNQTKQNRFVPRHSNATHMCYTGKMKSTGKGEAGGKVTPSAASRLELETIVTMISYYSQSQLLLCNRGEDGGGVARRGEEHGMLRDRGGGAGFYVPGVF